MIITIRIFDITTVTISLRDLTLNRRCPYNITRSRTFGKFWAWRPRVLTAESLGIRQLECWGEWEIRVGLL